MAAKTETKPKKLMTAYWTLSQRDIIVPGCMIQLLMLSSARVMPERRRVLEALLDRSCPIIAMITVTNDISMVFASIVVIKAADEGLSLPCVPIISHLGPIRATMTNMPERIVEYNAKKMVMTDTQFLRLPFTPFTLSHLWWAAKSP